MVPRTIGVLLAVAFAVVLTAPSTAATLPEYRPAVMRMDYAAGDLVGTVHSPRTLVGPRPVMVVGPRGADLLGPEMARQGFVVVVARSGAPSRHLELWREVSVGRGPLAERFHGFAGALDLTGVVAEP